MTVQEIINGLEFTKAMFLFDPSTGEEKTKKQLNNLDRTTVDACEGAIELLKQYKAIEDVPYTNTGELISRDKVIEAIDDISVEVDEGYGFQYEKWRKYFCELSSADLFDYCDKLWKLAYERGKAEGQPQNGKWIKDTKRFGDDNYHCSVCSAVLEEDDVKWKNNYFCYHCGAAMRGNLS